MCRFINLFLIPLFHIVYSKRDCWLCTHFNLQSHKVKCMKLYIIFHYSTSRTDDFAQKCMKSAKSSISFGYTKRDCWLCTHIYLQSLYFILSTAKEIVASAHILTCRAMKWNVWNCISSFTTLHQELMILQKSVWRVQNHQSLLVPFISYWVQQNRLMILHTLLPTKP